MTKTPPLPKRKYNQSLTGQYGEFGSGANTRVVFIQTAIRPADLNKTTLISDIQGSEAWPVRNLFQRDVDLRRVTNHLLPYLQDANRVKFFNPLTLTVLPFDPDTREVLGSMPKVTESIVEEDGQKWRVTEMAPFYKFKHLVDIPAWGELEWDDSVVNLVAIDGQHRLSALKRFHGDPKADAAFQKWSIPVVIVGFRGMAEGTANPTILEVVRSIFIYINTEARTPTRTRQILLSDEDINAICTQELLQFSHSNDVVAPSERQAERLPLLCFDWRGEEDDGRPVPSPAAIKSTEEIANWFEYYIAGENFSTDQEVALGIQPVDTQLKQAFMSKRLDAETSNVVRTRVNADLVPGLAHVLENFKPYEDYVTELRRLETDYLKKSDVARHAFDKLRFGVHRAGETLHSEVFDLYDQLVKDIQTLQAKLIRPPLSQDIGMRGVMYAYGSLMALYSDVTGKVVPWKAYAQWFTDRLNQGYADGWFDIKQSNVRTLLKHIAIDHNENVVNYRLEDQADALGAMVSLLVCAYGARKKGILYEHDAWENKRGELGDSLESCLLRGYKKEVRPELRDKYPQGGKELTEAVKKEATRRTEAHMKKIDKAIDAIVSKA